MFREFLIYGATGFTGRLVARRAVELGLKPTLAGRSASRLKELAEELQLPHAVFALDDASAMDAEIAKQPLVLNCAGPFTITGRPVVEACLRTRRHYVDITGEVALMEEIYARDAEARAAGVVLLPAAGFDVVPSDCLAAYLKSKLPSTTRLTLAFRAQTRVSPGTAATMIEHMGEPGLVRRGGTLTPVPQGSIRRSIDFGDGRARTCLAIPWGDLASAWRTTGIPDIEVCTPAPWAARAGLKLASGFGGVFRPLVRRLIRWTSKGPSAELQKSGRSTVWGEATDASGARVRARIEATEPYRFTAESAVEAVRRILKGDVAPGAKTPAAAFGADFVLQLSGNAREDLP